jgi:hypothetical protein
MARAPSVDDGPPLLACGPAAAASCHGGASPCVLASVITLVSAANFTAPPLLPLAELAVAANTANATAAAAASSVAEAAAAANAPLGAGSRDGTGGAAKGRAAAAATAAAALEAAEAMVAVATKHGRSVVAFVYRARDGSGGRTGGGWCKWLCARAPMASRVCERLHSIFLGQHTHHSCPRPRLRSSLFMLLPHWPLHPRAARPAASPLLPRLMAQVCGPGPS